jgi:RNA polymerase sigma factor (sigma-70 family)
MLDPRSAEFNAHFAALLANARAGSSSAMGELLQFFSQMLYDLAMRFAPKQRDRWKSPSDFVEETILNAVKNFAQFQGNCAVDFRAWLRTMLQNLITDFSRANRRLKRHSSQEKSLDSLSLRERVALCGSAASDLCETLVREAASLQFKLCYAELSESDQSVLQMHVSESLSFREIGSRLGISEQAARQRCCRARREFAKLLSRHRVCEY